MRSWCAGNLQLVEWRCEKPLGRNSLEVEEDDVETLRTMFLSERSHPFYFCFFVSELTTKKKKKSLKKTQRFLLRYKQEVTFTKLTIGTLHLACELLLIPFPRNARATATPTYRLQSTRLKEKKWKEKIKNLVLIGQFSFLSKQNEEHNLTGLIENVSAILSVKLNGSNVWWCLTKN